MHPGDDELQALAAHGEVTRHVLDCLHCSQLLRDLVSPGSWQAPLDITGPVPGEEGPPSTLEEAVLLRALDMARRADVLAAAQKRQAQGAFEELLRHPPEARAEAVETEPRFRSLALAELALEAAEEAAEEDPPQSRHFAGLAVAILERLPETSRSRGYHAAAYALLADAERRQGRREVAEDLLAAAVRLLRDDPLDSEPRARLCRALGELRREQGRVDEALALFTRARTLAQQTRATLELMRAGVAEGWLLLEEFEPEAALAPLRQAEELAADQRLWLAAAHGLVLALAESGRHQELTKAVGQLAALRYVLASPRDQLRVDWIQAQVERRLGEKETARQHLEEVFERFLQAGYGIEAAGVALELAHHELDRPEETDAGRLQTLAGALAERGGLPSHLAAVMEFALLFPLRSRTGFTHDVLRQASEYLLQARLNPALLFHPLPEPHLVFLWSHLTRPQRQQAAEAAGVTLDPLGEPRSRRDRWWITWTHEALTGVRIEVPAGNGPDLDETDPG